MNQYQQKQNSILITQRQPQQTQKYPKDMETLDNVSLKQLRDRNKDTQNAIKAVKSRIHYMKNKEQKTVRKVLNVKRKLTSLQSVRNKAKQIKQQSIQQKRRSEEATAQKAQFNKLIKDHLKYNKKIVMTLMNHKINEDVKNFKQKKQQFSVLHNIQKDNISEDNSERANKVRLQHIEAHEKRKLYFLDKLKQFKDYKQVRLKQQIKQRQRQQNMIQQLQQKERSLLQRLSVSQKFRLKCQQEYQQAKRKYHSFYEASRGVSRESSLNQTKAQIFIS